ncbi:acyl-CoA thioesterase [Nocardioides mangrovicus]|uniref:Acyl-CoA thioesterase n=2 Tax=Nocardioides mangrovicus TaxID=2478913 RepID=A0A3L8P4B0_9ACTN|nr:acyl-CoA thioesterase [Nocardioides mangrovicus]
MRWADMDMLGHVNNVTYVDYLQEARIDMLATHAPVQGGEELAEGTVVVRHEVHYVSPLVFRQEPVTIECWVTEIRAASFTMAYEIVDVVDGERVVHLRATTIISPFVFAEERPRRLSASEKEALSGWLEPGFESAGPVPAVPAPGARHVFPLFVRWSDVDAYGHVNNVTYFEYFQESRIAYLWGLPRPEDGDWTPWVVAQTDVEYRRPILFRREPYAVHSWVHAVGGRSAVLVSEIRDDDHVLARARVVMVAFDRETQRSAAMNPAQHGRLEAEVSG